MRVAIYVRVSTLEQAREGFSIPAQIESLRAFCKSMQWEIVVEYIEDGKSAKDLNRPKMKEMLKDMKKKKFDLVLVHKLDRLTRSVRDLHNLLDEFEKYGVKFRSATEVYDTTTALGRLFITLVAAMAQWERENLAERVNFGIDQMIEEGKRPGGHSAFGYKFDKDNNCEVIEEEAEWVLKIFEWYAAGWGYRKIADRLNELQVKTPTVTRKAKRKATKWNSATIFGMLRNDVYIGTYRRDEKIIQNNHPAIISNSLFFKVQQAIKNKQKDQSRMGKFPLTGILVCGHCSGYPINGFYDKRDNKTYYRCLNCNRLTDAKRIIDSIISEIELMITSKAYFMKQVDKNYEMNHVDVNDIKKKLDKINQQKEKWYSLFLDDDNPIPKETLYGKINELNEEENDLRALLQEAEVTEESPEQKYEKLQSIKDFRFIYHEADPFEQKEMLHNIFEEICMYRERGKNKPITLDLKLR